jgi:hypothetical protein
MKSPPKLALASEQNELFYDVEGYVYKKGYDLRKLWAASTIRNGNELYIWSSGSGIPKKQIGLRNLMRTSTTSDCEWSITGGILRARRILESNG